MWTPFQDQDLMIFGLIESIILLLFTATVLSTPRDAILKRLTSVLALSILTYYLQQEFAKSCSHSLRSTISPMCFSLQLLHASELLLISRVTYSDFDDNNPPSIKSKEKEKEEEEEPKSKTNPTPLPSRIKKSISLSWNARRIGTKWQIKGFSTTAASSDSRTTFILKRFSTLLISYILMEVLLLGQPPDPALISQEKETLFRYTPLSLSDIIFRIFGTASLWLACALFNLMLANFMNIVCVLLTLNTPAECPPHFGSFSEAYTVRGFWGSSWHQALRKCLTGHADFIANEVFRIPRNSILSRYTRLFLAFFISGAIHHTSDVALSIPPAEYGSLLFFSVQPLGIMLEDGVQALVKNNPIFAGRPRLRRFIGYLWVVVFFFWSTPTWVYPQMRAGEKLGGRKTDMLPFGGIVGPLIRYFRT